ncbi:hypothetical protein TNIN_19351 [Trichonephila inaurata madagascariensis]|uniref:Uncharacterized protein n=1 Tax=Trichonephila inaurata madagascariensis TaxID=2747483 RepID=A0A8X6KL23_9ARAC|nr:hypothetical protein TNIN_19351 [Trichonephila inaurata madagascariensis]
MGVESVGPPILTLTKKEVSEHESDEIKSFPSNLHQAMRGSGLEKQEVCAAVRTLVFPFCYSNIYCPSNSPPYTKVPKKNLRIFIPEYFQINAIMKMIK